MTDGREKGQSYMREVCDILSRWAGTPSGTFKPRPTLVEPPDGWVVKGDVSFPSTLSFPFVVECKKIEGWSLDALVEGKAKDVFSWWLQCVRQATATPGARKNARPLLIFSRNRRKNYVMALELDFRRLGFRPRDPYLTLALGADRVGVAHLSELTSTTTPTRNPGHK